MKICLVCSHGGHLTEMRELEAAFKDHDICYLTYRSERTRNLPASCLIDNLADKPWTLVLALLRIAELISREKPRIMISTGAEIAIPAFFLARLAGINTIFVETCARVRTPSMTARLVYHMSDFFFVQWENLTKCFGRNVRYEGGLL